MCLVAIFVGIINPILAYPLFLQDFWHRRKPIFTSLMLALVMAYIAFYAESKYTGDLERYMIMLSSYKNVPFTACFDRIYTRLYVMDIIFWVCARFENPRVFVAIVAFLMYFMVYYIVLDYCKQKELNESNSRFLVLTLLFLLPFYYFISSTRSSLAMMTGMMALYLEVYRKHRNPFVYLLYVIPIMIHEAAIVIVLLRLLWLLPDKTRKIVTGVVIALVLMMGLGVFNFAERLIGTGENFLTDALNMAVGYSAYGTEQYSLWQTNLRTGLYTQTLKLYYAIIMIFILLPSSELDDNTGDQDIVKFTRSAALLILALMLYPTGLYLRFVTGFVTIFVIAGFLKYQSRWKPVMFVVTFGSLMLQMYSLFEPVPYGPFFSKLAMGIFNFL